MSKIILSPKYGLNPSVEECLFCEKSRGVLTFGRITRKQAREMFPTQAENLAGDDDDVEAPPKVLITPEPCPDCETFTRGAADGVWFIQADEIEGHPIPTGKLVCIREVAVRELVEDAELLKHMLKSRLTYVDHSTWAYLGLDAAKTRKPEAEPSREESLS